MIQRQLYGLGRVHWRLPVPSSGQPPDPYQDQALLKRLIYTVCCQMYAVLRERCRKCRISYGKHGLVNVLMQLVTRLSCWLSVRLLIGCIRQSVCTNTASVYAVAGCVEKNPFMLRRKIHKLPTSLSLSIVDDVGK